MTAIRLLAFAAVLLLTATSANAQKDPPAPATGASGVEALPTVQVYCARVLERTGWLKRLLSQGQRTAAAASITLTRADCEAARSPLSAANRLIGAGDVEM